MLCSENSQLVKGRILLCSSELGFSLPHYYLGTREAYGEGGSRDGAGLSSPRKLILKLWKPFMTWLSLKHQAKLQSLVPCLLQRPLHIAWWDICQRSSSLTGGWRCAAQWRQWREGSTSITSKLQWLLSNVHNPEHSGDSPQGEKELLWKLLSSCRTAEQPCGALLGVMSAIACYRVP